VTNYDYAYDFAGNRLVAATNTIVNNLSYNALNQLMSSTWPTNDVTYEWDAENRLTAINHGPNRSEFFYDGLGRRVQIIEMVNGNTVSNNFFVWCGAEICEQRDSTGGNITKRFFVQGEQSVTLNTQLFITNYYYTRDHLGSVREALDLNGNTETRYDYDPYGHQTVIQDNFTPTFAYTGAFYYSPSALCLTLARPLDVSSGHWLARDPLEETAGLNLYSYVGGEPLIRVDILGYSWSGTLYNWTDSFLGWLPNQLVNTIAGGQPFLNAVQGGLEGWDPSDGGLASLYSMEGLGGNRCSQSYKNAKLVGEAYGLISGAGEIGMGIKGIKAAKRLPLFITGGNGAFNWGSISQQADRLAQDVSNAERRFGELTAERLSGEVVGGNSECNCQSQ
jgi:RHS repeat-associated protein